MIILIIDIYNSTVSHILTFQYKTLKNYNFLPIITNKCVIYICFYSNFPQRYQGVQSIIRSVSTLRHCLCSFNMGHRKTSCFLEKGIQDKFKTKGHTNNYYDIFGHTVTQVRMIVKAAVKIILLDYASSVQILADISVLTSGLCRDTEYQQWSYSQRWKKYK